MSPPTSPQPSMSELERTTWALESPWGSWSAAIKEFVARVRAINAVPILGTQPPTDLTTPVARKQEILRFNAWLRRYAAVEGLPSWTSSPCWWIQQRGI